MSIKKSCLIVTIFMLSGLTKAADTDTHFPVKKHIQMFIDMNQVVLTPSETNDLNTLIMRCNEYSNTNLELVEHIIDQITQFKRFSDHGWHSEEASLLNFFVGPVTSRKHSLSPSNEEIVEFNQYVLKSGNASPVRLYPDEV